DPITLTRGTYEGYKFVRWDAVQPQGLTINNNNNTFTMPAAKVEVTAVWEAIPYTITVKDGVGGTGSTANKLTAIIKEAVQLTHGTPDTGYEFDAWVVSPAGVVIGADDTFAMPVDNVEVTATWKKTDYTITVNPSGGTGTAASQQTANYGDEIRLTRGLHEEAGITFVRWEVVQPQGLVINADDTFTMPAANVVIAAKWNAVNYNITVADGTGGSGSAADKPTAIIKTTVQLTRGTEQAGYEFDKWVISPASVFIGADDTFVMPAGDVNVTATWKKIDYTITVNQGGGSDSAASHQTAQIGDPITLTRGTYEGYKFVRWDAVQPQGLTINNNNNTFTMPAAKVEITAVWEAIPYTITVKDSVGGSGTVADKTTATIKEAVQLTRGTKQAGYEFDTWLISPASVLLGANNAFIMPAENVEVTAVWKAIDYTITVHPNGGEGTAASKTTAAHVGDTITLTRGTRTGDYDFSTWAVSPASVQVGADDTFTMPASNVEITAQWVRKPSKVEITSDHILTAQGLELTFAATVTPQDDTPPYEWSVTGNEYVSFVGNVLKVPPHAKPGTITVTASVKGYPGVKDEREITILQSTANSSGTSHTAAIRNDGTLWSSGRNNVRQLGNNSTVDSKVFVQLLGGVNTWVSVSAGYTHTAAIRSDGTLWLWGEGTYGKLGNGGTSGSHGFAAQISGGGTWVFVSAGGHHTTAIKSDGTLWLWGQNDQGQLGDESTTDRSRPLQVSGGGSWRSVSAGGSHTAAIKSDGTLWLWGLNNLGQLGDGTTTKSSVPIQLAGDGTTWASVSAGSLHTAAIKSDGTLWSWGGNVFGQLGNGLTTDSKVPVQVSGGGTWSSVSAGMYYTAGIKIDGTLWLWGWNNKGQLGDNSTTNRSRPVQVSGGGTTWISVYAGKSQHTTAMQSGGQLMVWGDNQYGQLGDNATVDRKIPARVGATWLVYPAN
ncbi:MAG: InlB B-repeat-containing protein, partial [Treponema sp.]|nr:InlB B-repeat-containing protein [Treponema sp.]